ncbi:MAG: cobalamin biosynthesis protein CbiA [Deltaproteobacteria bacterium]|nr:cobalamin biosynthesis protein CbiA [Deltaproteobacteria bacterium]
MSRQPNNSLSDEQSMDINGFRPPEKRLNIVVGAFGSGKTEVSVNWAISLARQGLAVKLADLDIANPYFRSREAQQLLRENGVVPIIPTGEVQFSDLPVLIPQIKGLMQHSEKSIAILDVGGDEQGARILASLRNALGAREYSLFQVINSRRPFTDTVDGCVEMIRNIERVSGLNVTATIVNSHLMEYTTKEIILEGMEMGEAVSQRTGIPVAFATVMGDALDVTKLRKCSSCHIAVMQRNMLPPWLSKNAQNSWPLAAGDRRG